VKVINDQWYHPSMTVLYLPTANSCDEEKFAIPYHVVQDILLIEINEMELQNDRNSQRKIS